MDDRRSIDEHDRLWCEFWNDLLATAVDADDRARITRARDCAERCAARHV